MAIKSACWQFIGSGSLGSALRASNRASTAPNTVRHQTLNLLPAGLTDRDVVRIPEVGWRLEVERPSTLAGQGVTK